MTRMSPKAMNGPHTGSHTKASGTPVLTTNSSRMRQSDMCDSACRTSQRASAIINTLQPTLAISTTATGPMIRTGNVPNVNMFSTEDIGARGAYVHHTHW